MRVILNFAASLLPLLAACGSSHDRDPEEVSEPLVVLQGEFIEGEARSEDTYPFLDFYRYEVDLDDVPFGFDYSTYDVFFDEWDRLWVEYDLEIAPWVAPGDYYFTATYDFYDLNSIFREEVEFRFYVRVVEGFHRVELRGRQGLAPEEREQGGDTEVLIE